MKIFTTSLLALLTLLIVPATQATPYLDGDAPRFSRVVTNHAPAVLNAPSLTYADCYAVGEKHGKLISFRNSSGGSVTVEGDTGRDHIEAIALSLDGSTLYAADAGRFGRIDISNGNWTSIGTGFGTGNGSVGSVSFNDVDGMAFDPTTGILYGVQRRPGTEDVLFQINVATGGYVNNAFGGNDYVVIARHTLPQNDDDLFYVDDIAIHPTTGVMYGSLYRNGNGSDHTLFTINKNNGSISRIGPLYDNNYRRDMEGLTMDKYGNLYGTTGKDGQSNTNNNLYRIDIDDADTHFRKDLSGDSDFEGVACVTGDNTPPPPGPSCPANLNIDSKAAGDFVDTAGFFPGVTVAVSGAGFRRPMIFDTSNPTGNDNDLGTPNQAFSGPGVGSGGASNPGANNTAQGKAIIISTDNDPGDPDDHSGGGTITFTFSGLVEFDSIALLDIENSNSTVTAKDANGNVIKTVSVHAFGDNSFEMLPINASGVKSLEVFFNNESGAIADLFFCATDLECAATGAPFLDFENLTDSGQPPEGGDELKFTAPFTNNTSATDDASNVEVTAIFDPVAFTYVGGSATGGTSQDESNAAAGEIVFTINTLAPNATATLMFNLIVNGGVSTGTVTTSVTAATEFDIDSTPDNFSSAPGEDDTCSATFQNLPVELTAFDAQADGRSATLSWSTASETNNAGFELQHRYLDEASKSHAAFNARAFIEGHGTTTEAKSYSFRLDNLEPGRHVFRLKQIDYDGTFDYSPEIEIAVELPEAFLVSPVYPNPFNPQASFSFSVSRSQQVDVSVYNMLGQRVMTLFSGVAAEGTARTLQIDGSGLESGTYIVRVLGETFINTQTMTLVK